MSSYADVGDVQALIPQRRFGPQTTPTPDDVLRYCARRSGELDALMADKGIAAPLDSAASPLAFAWARSAASYGAAMDAEAAGFPGQGDHGESPRLAFLRGQWERMIDALIAGEVRLTDAPRLDDASGTAGFRFAGGSAGAGPWFDRGQTFTGGNGPSTILPG